MRYFRAGTYSGKGVHASFGVQTEITDLGEGIERQDLAATKLNVEKITELGEFKESRPNLFQRIWSGIGKALPGISAGTTVGAGGGLGVGFTKHQLPRSE